MRFGFFRLLLFFLFAPASAGAFVFSPTLAEFSPSGEKAARQFVAENPGAFEVKAEIGAFLRTIDSDGNEHLTPTSDFKIEPKQFQVSAGNKEIIKIKYQGASELRKEVAYRFIVQQITSGAPVGDEYVFRYVTAIYVAPSGAKPEVKITALMRGKFLDLQLRNEGTARQVLDHAVITLSANGKKTVMKTLKKFEKQILLAGTQRSFQFPRPSTLALTSIAGDQLTAQIFFE
jgi:P pilus assembly chaperone PapD